MIRSDDRSLPECVASKCGGRQPQSLLAGTTCSPRLQVVAVEGGRPAMTPVRPPLTPSDLRLLGDLQRIIDFDAKVSDRRLELGVPE